MKRWGQHVSASLPMTAVIRFSSRLVLGAALVLPLAGFFSFEKLFAPKAEIWERWGTHDPSALSQIDHRTWDRTLKSYVARGWDSVNRFAYGRVTNADKGRIDTYIASLTATSISRYNRSEQRAYWINLYNALTVKIVLEHYPVNSIRDIDISPGFFADGPWNRKLVEVENEALSLNDIEHRILRPIWRDPLIHYAVNCASVACPNLQNTAFTAANTEALLDIAARDYINSPRGVRIENGMLVVSSIYVWFAEDFGDSDDEIIAHLNHFASPSLVDELKGVQRIGGHRYDWKLNVSADDAT